MCCGAILIPIIWSIKHLRDAAASDGKLQRNLQKLRLFRYFYLIVVVYIYFTRIVVLLTEENVGYRWTWVGPFINEAVDERVHVVDDLGVFR